ncbi:hypothetical protein [Macellibacteroides fermentans]|jgi:recombinational DNA repair protein (RecF pathway)|uniref:Recombinational DNA repair protein (RecF pathway) n=1 Tax=Macellibacteroides fermentans TaxID=879969 RepID=A0A8E2A4I4_9PORP|nr:hypothetical protein [Macellibacteroides fermentans]NYI50673.1 recombinational DNA repair protein (RecF pathway) [Macellibacteroides fermentans]
MNDSLIKEVELILEEMRVNMIQSAKSKNLEWVKSEKNINGVVMANFSIYGIHIIAEITKRLGLSQDEAEILFEKAKANLYDKYNELKY